MTVRVMIVDDHRIVLEGLKELIRHEPDVTLVGEAVSVHEALRKAAVVRPDVVLMDVRLPDGNGIEATRVIRARLPDTQVLLLTVCEDHETALRALRAGAVGYVLKDIPPAHLMRAIKSVSLTRTMVHTMVPRKLIDQMATAKRSNGSPLLTQREIAVLREVAAGLADKEIASKMLLTVTTVKSHLRSAYRKLGIHNRAQAAIYAVKAGLDDLAVLPIDERRFGSERRGVRAFPALLGGLIAPRRSS